MFDVVQIARAIATNQLARVAPAAYLRLTGQTGRGSGSQESQEEVGAYFRRCVGDYLARLGVPRGEAERCLSGKVILEYGPGDLPGVAALLISLGADKVYCVDRFPMVSLSRKNALVMQDLIAHCSDEQRAKMMSCLRDPKQLALGFSPAKIEYLVKPHGLSGMVNEVDLVISRAVLEHVDDLEATFADMVRAMRPGARAVHLVDLKSHGLHRRNPLDFLECPAWLWKAMFSHKGVPNRWRLDRYREILSALGLTNSALEATQLAKEDEVLAVRPRLARMFRGVSDTDLAWLGFWLTFSKPLR
jgi:SAM-dependent methyltransferase